MISDMNEAESGFDFEAEHPFIARIDAIGFRKFRQNPECQKKIFCEMSTFGMRENANTVQKVFHYLSLMCVRFPTYKHI